MFPDFTTHIENGPGRLYNIGMARTVTKLEDFGDERDQAVFAVIAKKWFNGDLQALFDDYNRKQAEREELEKKPGVVFSVFDNVAEVRLRFPHQ